VDYETECYEKPGFVQYWIVKRENAKQKKSKEKREIRNWLHHANSRG